MREKGLSQLIFVVGPPASGKTSICNEVLRILISAGAKTSYISDGEVLKNICDEDALETRHQVVNGVVVIGDEVRNEIYQRLASRVTQNKDNNYIIIEIATTEWEVAFSYYSAANLKYSLLIKVVSTLQECLYRNRQRHLQSPDQFNTFVPESFITTFFTPERQERLPSLGFGLSDSFILDNSGISLQILYDKTGKIVRQFLEK